MTHPLRGPVSRRSLPTALLGLVVGLAVLLLPAAAQAAGSAPTTPPGQSWVRVGHFVPGMGSTRVELVPLGGDPTPVRVARAATYGEVSAYGKVPPGSYTAIVRDGGGATTSTDEPLLSRALQVRAGEARTIAVLGTPQQPRLVLLEDDLTPPPAGSARVRLLLAAEGEDAVTVQAVDGPTLAEGAVLGQATAYTTVPAGSWDLELSGSATAGATTTPTTEQGVAIAAGSVYTVVALSGADRSVELQVVTDAAGAAVTPRGGARTGGGGLAAGGSEASPTVAWGLGVVPALAGAVLAGVLLRRRRRPTAAR